MPILTENQIKKAMEVGTSPDFWEGCWAEEWVSAPVGTFVELEDCAMVKVRMESTSTFDPRWNDYRVTHDHVQVALSDLHHLFA